MAMRCAERTGTGMMLWQHEFYMVMEPRHGAYLYQALEFQVGSTLPLDEVEGSTIKQKKEVWVRGVAYAPALHVRKFDKAEQRKGYLFHTAFQDGDGDLALFEKCPEVVRVDNCTAWRRMSSVLETIPRIVHPMDIKTRIIHVAGREWHLAFCVRLISKGGEGNIYVAKNTTIKFCHVSRRCTRTMCAIGHHYVGAFGKFVP